MSLFSLTFRQIRGSSFSVSRTLKGVVRGHVMSDMHFVSKSVKFFGRHLPQTVFRSVPIRSVKSRLFFTVTPSRTVTPRDDTNYPQALEITGLLDVSKSFTWVYYKTKGYKKSLMP